MRTATRVALGVLAAALLWAASTAPAALAASCGDEFTGPEAGSWSDPSNWSAGLPGASSVVCWSTSTTVVVAEGAQQAASIASGGGLEVSGQASLTLAGTGEASALAAAARTSEAGSLSVSGPLACASLAISGGSVRDDGQIECATTVAGGRLDGSGVIAGPLYDDEGSVEPGDPLSFGTLHVDGAYVQQAGGTLVARARGLGAGEAAELAVEGPVALSGTVSLQLGFASAAGESLPVIESATVPAGAFTHVSGFTEEAPWTVEYGSAGVRGVYATPPLLHVSVAGTPEPGQVLRCDPGAWAPGPITYGWQAVKGTVATPVFDGSEEPEEEDLGYQLQEDATQQLTPPGAAFGHAIGCHATAEVELAGYSSAARREEAMSGQVQIGGPYRTLEQPSIHGTVAPWHRLTCSPGRWEGAPSSYSYRWSSGAQTLGASSSYEVAGLSEGSTVTCTVSAHYGTIAIPASTSVELPDTPLPVECAGLQVVLISARRAGADVLLFGDAAGEDFGGPVYALAQTGRGRRRRVAEAKVGTEGYFLLRVPLRDGVGARTRYFALAGGRRSNAMQVSRVLRITADSSSPGNSHVVLRLARGLGAGATVTLSRIGEGCGTYAPVVTTHVRSGGILGVTLTAPKGAETAVPYVARTRIGGHSYSVELVVPALREFIPVG